MNSGTLDTPRAGRRPGKSVTREAILRVAAGAFGERGFDETSLRRVARDAGVDPALIIHYFGSKAGLFVAAFEWRFDPKRRLRRVMRHGPGRAGEELVLLFLEIWDREGRRHPMISLLRSATVEPAAAALMRDMLRERLFEPLLGELGTDQPELRANLVASQLLGLAVTRHVLELEAIAGAQPDDIVAAVAPTVQRYLTGDLG